MKMRIVSFLLVIALISELFIGVEPIQATPDDTKNQYVEAIMKVEEANDEVRKCDEKISQLMVQQNETNSKIENIKTEIENKEKEIEKTEETIVGDAEELKKRVRSTYKNGNDITLDIVFDAESFSDLIYRQELIRNVTGYELRAIDRTKEAKKTLVNCKKDLEKEVENLSTLKEDLQKQIESIESEKVEHQKVKTEAEAVSKQYADQLKVIYGEIEAKAQILQAQINAGVKVTSTGETVSETALAILKEANNHLGKKYVWGATGPNTFDCSGLTQYVYGKLGISLTRTTYTQVRQGQYVAPKDVQPGDLVFFGSIRSPHHVGIYAGDGMFIHAPQTGDVVKYSKLSYMPDYTQARRIIG